MIAASVGVGQAREPRDRLFRHLGAERDRAAQPPPAFALRVEILRAAFAHLAAAEQRDGVEVDAHGRLIG